ncbi:NAD(P)-binding protein [Lactarius quietus]|nr:NAD(P)-binding protein [Lactarius quietus]
MVAVASPAKVLVTGANGYIAVWIVKKYLEAGYSVRGTVRSLSRSAFLKEQFAEYGERFELVVVEDITKDGAFDEAVKGVDAIAHTASPFHFNATEPDELIVPAVKGTTTILNSTLKHGTGVKRIVLTSSLAAVREADPRPRNYDETNWNKPPSLRWRTLAERAAWEFVDKHKSELAWDLVVLNPPFVFGPSLSPAPTINDINTRADWRAVTGQGNWVHVSVVGDAHVRATHAAAAGGERIIVSSGYFFFQDFLDVAAELGITNVARGEPYSTANIPRSTNVVSTKAVDLLGLKGAAPLKDVIEESVKDFKARGYPGFTA